MRTATRKGYGALVAACVVALALPCSAAATSGKVEIAMLDHGTRPTALSRVPRLSPGLLGAGLGRVALEQTYLDISQGNRIFGSLYDGSLPFLLPTGPRVPHWNAVVRRADSAPAEIVPGLLASSLERAGVPVRADRGLVDPAIIAADRAGRIERFDAQACRRGHCPEGVSVVAASIRDLPAMVAGLRGDDMLIAIERAPPRPRRQLTIGVAARGFDGLLTSDSTRLRGLVLTTDLGPTVLSRYRIDKPTEFSGEPIRSEGSRDFAEVESLQKRLAQVGPRRKTVIGDNLLIWVLLVGVAAIASRGRAARPALRLLAVSGAYLPFMLLVCSAIEPSLVAERLLVGAGVPALAALTLALIGGYGALSVACGVTVIAYAADMAAGSPLTALSLAGPNPMVGVRFYGIGNELEAALASLVLIGTGAGLAAWLPPDRRRAAAVWFGGTAAVAALIFSAGRFGADVGAAIVLSAGGAVAIAVVVGARRRAALLVLAAPVAGLGALIGLDLAFGGNSHLTRSVLDAGGFHQVGEVLERRIRLSARSFARPRNSTLLPLAILAILLAIVFRRRIAAWFEGRPAALAGFLGGIAVTVVGTLANDSGALLLLIGTGYLSLFAAFAWTQPPALQPRTRDRNSGGPAG